MKILVLALIILFIAGCAKQEAAPVVVDEPKNETVVEAPKVDLDNTIVSLGNGLYKVNYGEEVTFQGKKFKINDIDKSTGRFKVMVGSEELLFQGTKEPEVTSGLKVHVEKMESTGPDVTDTSLILSIAKFALGADEYLVRKGSPVTVSSASVSVDTSKIDSNMIRSIPVSVGTETNVKINEGNTYSFKTLDVTNVKTFVFDKSYAVLKIVPKPAAPEAPVSSGYSY